MWLHQFPDFQELQTQLWSNFNSVLNSEIRKDKSKYSISFKLTHSLAWSNYTLRSQYSYWSLPLQITLQCSSFFQSQSAVLQKSSLAMNLCKTTQPTSFFHPSGIIELLNCFHPSCFFSSTSNPSMIERKNLDSILDFCPWFESQKEWLCQFSSLRIDSFGDYP